MEYDRGINATLDTSQMDSMYPYILFTKIILLLWDVIGLVVNGLGIDLMWHGIEINHAVYSLVLQDIVLCWLSSLLWCSLNWIWWSTSGMFWCLQTLNITVTNKNQGNPNHSRSLIFIDYLCFRFWVVSSLSPFFTFATNFSWPCLVHHSILTLS